MPGGKAPAVLNFPGGAQGCLTDRDGMRSSMLRISTSLDYQGDSLQGVGGLRKFALHVNSVNSTNQDAWAFQEVDGENVNVANSPSQGAPTDAASARLSLLIHQAETVIATDASAVTAFQLLGLLYSQRSQSREMLQGLNRAVRPDLSPSAIS